MTRQDLRAFLKEVEENCPEDVVRLTAEIAPEYEMTAVMMELDKKEPSPLVYFENIKGKDMPVVSNVISSRKRLALALGVDEPVLPTTYAQRCEKRAEPELREKGAFEENSYYGEDIDITKFPILTHFNIDGGPYITGGIVIANDLATGTNTGGFHRLQVKGKNKLGISLHSRKRLWEYHRRAEEKGKSLPAAIVIGVHPNICMGSMALIPYDEGKFELMGGLFQEPLQIARCKTVDVAVPAWAEIVIEGEILKDVREPEGPFGEFTGYTCLRSTENVFEIKAVHHRNNAIYHSVNPGLSSEHNTVLAVHREGDVFAALRRTLPNIKKVHVPLSGCGIFHCYISMKKIAEGQPLQAIFTAFSVDHGIKMVIVVDEDIDVFNEKEVLWAMSTRLQADRGVFTTSQKIGMGVTLDPSTDELSRTAKFGIDATRPAAGFAHVMKVEEEVRRRILPLLS